jgi:hypothetical protein
MSSITLDAINISNLVGLRHWPAYQPPTLNVPTSALGQKQTYALQQAMSALPPKATLNAFFRIRERPADIAVS